jgi:hypothetical protein
MRKTAVWIALMILGLQAQAQVPVYVPTSSLLGYWPMHNNLTDSSANSYDGTGSTFTYTYDRRGALSAACNLPGGSSYVQMSGLPVNTRNDYTLNYWMNLKIYNEDDVLIDIHPADVCGNYMQLLESGDSINLARCDLASSAVSLGHKADYTNFWRMMTVVVKTDTTWVYRDGELLLKAPFSWDVSSTVNLVLANRYNAANAYDKGANVILDDVGLWSRVLTPCEIGDLYNSGLLVLATQPADQWGMEAGSASFSVSTTRSRAGYQWQSNLGAGGTFLDLSNSGQYSGVYSATLTVSGLVAANDGQLFRCILKDSTSDCSVTSDEAELSVSPLSLDGFSLTSSDYLHQNMPNPSDGNTTIPYYIHSGQQQAMLVICDITGKQMFSTVITDSGKGALQLQKGSLPAGMYYYTLFVGGQKVDTRKMLITP